MIGYTVKIGDSLVSWKSKKQNTVSRSSVVAEYGALAIMTAEITWILGLMADPGIKRTRPADIQCDSKADIHMATNAVFQ